MPDPSIFILYSVSIRILLYTGFQNRPVQYFLAEIYIERSSPAAYTSLTTVASTPSLSVPTIISISANLTAGNVTRMTASKYLIHFIMCGQLVLFMLIPGILRELHFDEVYTLEITFLQSSCIIEVYGEDRRFRFPVELHCQRRNEKVSSDILIGMAKEFKVSTDYILSLSTANVRKSADRKIKHKIQRRYLWQQKFLFTAQDTKQQVGIKQFHT